MTRPHIRLLGPACCLSFSFALVSCDGRELVAPGVSPAGGVRPALSEPVSLGSAVLTPPPNTGAHLGAGATVGIGSVPANTWVVLGISGTVGGTRNPACDERPPAYPCPGGPVAQPFDSGADPYAPVTITYTYEQFGTRTGRVLLRGTGASAAVGLYRNDLPSMLQGFAKVNSLTSWDPNFGVMLPSYVDLSGGYSITATMVPSPFAVTESAPDDSGRVTYTAAPLYGLEFSNPPLLGHLPPGDLKWRWYPGNNLPDEPDGSWPGWYVYECEGKTVCNYRPPVPGRMQIRAYIETQTADVRSRLDDPSACSSDAASSNPKLRHAACSAQPPEKRLELICRVGGDPIVTDLNHPENKRGAVTLRRGELLSCVVRAVRVPADWRADSLFFVDSASHVIRASQVGGFGGTMVVGGTMTVMGRIDGIPRKDDVRVTVFPRDWSVSRPPIVTRFLGCTPPLTRECPVAFPPYFAHDMGRTRPPPRNVSWSTISGGPNRGWAYVSNTAPPYNPAQVEIVLNQILSPSDTSSWGRDFFKFYTNCTKEQARNEVEAHELVHANGYIATFPVINQYLESQVAWGVTLEEWGDRVFRSGDIATKVSEMMARGMLDHRRYPELLSQFPTGICGFKSLLPNPPGPDPWQTN